MANKGEHDRQRPPLSIPRILGWADAHFKQTGSWPTVESGAVKGPPDESWRAISQALDHGYRDLPGGSSLARLLAERRGMRNRVAQPRLTEKQILSWADAHHRATGRWPNNSSGPVRDAPHENWKLVGRALVRGDRGLSGGRSLAELLAKARGVRNPRKLPPLRVPQILLWADRHYRRYREWPNPRSGRVVGAITEDWAKINTALKQGMRGLAGGSSLPQLLSAYRGVRTTANLPRLTIKTILFWADAHFARTGSWPTETSGQVSNDPDESWKNISNALRHGFRGLSGGSSLARLLEEHRGCPNPGNRPILAIRQILSWADDHHSRTGKWPTHVSGRVLAEPSETWGAIHAALVNRLRGIRRRSSLAGLLGDRRGCERGLDRPRLSVSQILAWADAHYRRTGTWPNRSSGMVRDASGESWHRISQSLERGHRGLKGGSSLTMLLAEKRDYRNRRALPVLTTAQVLRWADEHKRQAGDWPNAHSGPVVGIPNENWRSIENALTRGRRGLEPGMTIRRLLAQHRGVRNAGCLPTLTEKQIAGWARAHVRTFGKWPTRSSGEVINVPGEKWANLDNALYVGLRGLPGGSSLARVRADYCD